jgi:hypothetical protein
MVPQGRVRTACAGRPHAPDSEPRCARRPVQASRVEEVQTRFRAPNGSEGTVATGGRNPLAHALGARLRDRCVARVARRPVQANRVEEVQTRFRAPNGSEGTVAATGRNPRAPATACWLRPGLHCRVAARTGRGTSGLRHRPASSASPSPSGNRYSPGP